MDPDLGGPSSLQELWVQLDGGLAVDCHGGALGDVESVGCVADCKEPAWSKEAVQLFEG